MPYTQNAAIVITTQVAVVTGRMCTYEIEKHCEKTQLIIKELTTAAVAEFFSDQS